MPDPTTEDLITETRTKLDQLIAQVATLQTAITTQVPPALTSTLIATRDKLQELITKLQANLDRLIEYQNALSASNLQEYIDALALFEICLETDSSVSTGNGWDKLDRTEQAYQAIKSIILAVGREMFDLGGTPDNVRGVLQCLDTIGGTRLRLIQDNFEPNPQAAAVTGLADRNSDGTAETSVISLYTIPLDNNNNPIPSFLHTAENIVHEFGHVLLDQNRGSMYDDWEAIRINFSRSGSVRDAIGVDDGWSVPAKRQNRFGIDKFPNCTDTNVPCQELEIERLADLFLFWVYQDDPDYGFDMNNPDPFISDVAVAFQNFIKTEGATWTRTTSTRPPQKLLRI